MATASSSGRCLGSGIAQHPHCSGVTTERALADTAASRGVFLVAGGLHGDDGENRLVEPVAATGAALDDELRVAGADGLKPPHHGSVVLEQPVAGAVRIDVSAGAALDVVVQFEVTHAEVNDQVVDRRVQPGDDRGVPEVELVAPPVLHSPAGPLEDRLRRKLTQQRTADPDDLWLEPQPGHHAALPDGVEHGPQATGEAVLRTATSRRRRYHQVTPITGSVGSVHCSTSPCQPASMQNTSAPASAAAAMTGSSFSVVGSPQMLNQSL